MEHHVVVSPPKVRQRNPGPEGGYRWLVLAQRRLPRAVFRFALQAGTWIAVAAMGEERRHSRAYLAVVTGRPATLLDVWRHFYAFVEFLMLRLQAANGQIPRVELDPTHAASFEALLALDQPALFGTFHFGHSDLLGFLLAERGRSIAMLRLRVDNSDDIRMFERQFGAAVSFVWVNHPADLLFALKGALEDGRSLAMQCDRPEFSAKTAVFSFLGAPRVFPFTIYHLAVVFGKPVMFCLGVPGPEGVTRVIANPVFEPDPALDRTENLRRAHEHFQAVLARLETLVRQYPLLWFNFRPLNAVPATAETARA